jgi:hypothetical protein
LAVISVFSSKGWVDASSGVTFEFSAHGAGLASGKPLVVHMPESSRQASLSQRPRPSVPNGVRSYLRLQGILCCTSRAAKQSGDDRRLAQSSSLSGRGFRGLDSLPRSRKTSSRVGIGDLLRLAPGRLRVGFIPLSESRVGRSLLDEGCQR